MNWTSLPANTTAGQGSGTFHPASARGESGSEPAARFLIRERQGRLLDLLHREVRRLEKPGADPWALAADDPSRKPELPKDATPAQLAAWTAVSRVLLNVDETITKE